MSKFKIFITLFIILIASIGSAQNNTKISKKLKNYIELKQKSEYSVYIFFIDKGNNISKKMEDAEKLLPENSIKRRKKLIKNKSSVATFYDIPVNENYFIETKKHISKLRHKLKWLNAISAEVTEENIYKIANLSFVSKIDIVRKGKVERVDTYFNFANTKPYNPFQNSPRNSKYDLDYGNSLTQMEQINVPVIHDMGYHGEGVIICVLDAGFNNLEHTVFEDMEFDNQIIGTWDFVNGDSNVDDESDSGSGDHGTMVLSTIGGFEDGELIGPAFKSEYILAKTENTESETTVEEDNWVAAITWAEDNYGPDVSSTSLGYVDFDDGSFYDASELDGNTAIITVGADIAAGLGILVVNSAGNSGPGPTTIGAPADGNYVMAVGAVHSDGVITNFSSEGPTGDGRIKPEVMALGADVYVAETPYGNGYINANGTSFSGPLVGGAAALLVQMLPTASNMDIINAMKMSADNSASPNNQYGWGIINVKAAYDYYNASNVDNVTNEYAMVSAFPNPANNTISFNTKSNLKEFKVEIYNQSGKLVKTINLFQNKNTVDISHLSSGFYLCKLTTDKSTSFIKIMISN